MLSISNCKISDCRYLIADILLRSFSGRLAPFHECPKGFLSLAGMLEQWQAQGAAQVRQQVSSISELRKTGNQIRASVCCLPHARNGFVWFRGGTNCFFTTFGATETFLS
jgi:hypothetical protein